MNRIFITGNLTADPNLQVSASGISVCHFNVADNYYANGEQKANFFRVTAFRGIADNCAKYLAKGRKVAIVGKVQQGEYTDSAGGKVKTFDIFVDEVQFLSNPDSESGTLRTTATSSKPRATLEPVDDDSLPF